MGFLRFLPALILSLGIAQSATVPNRFIVELSTEPLADHLARTGGGRSSLLSTAATSHRARIQAEQRQARVLLQQNGASVLEGVDTVANALFVQTTQADPEPWKNLPNVLRVTPVHTVEMLLDRAVVVNRITDAWAQIGGSGNAGLGVKIAILDSGVDITRPALLNSPLAIPPNFPLVNATSDTAFTNNKVIVARSYVSLLPNLDSDNSARDHSGHGTALAAIAAGGASAGPSATITGIAPGAWIGSYKVFGSPGQNDSASDDAILKALDDAVKDGMDVISLSFGSDIASRIGDDLEAQAVERATSAGAIVVIAAGNNGTDANTISTPGTAPDAITVGAQQNDRTFSASAQVAGLSPFLALPGDGPSPSGPVNGLMTDVQSLDGTGLACADLPAGSLSNRIALILRGSCTFEAKLNSAAKAGAAGALIYAAANAPAAIHITVGAAQLPAEMIDNADGVILKKGLAGGSVSTATLTFTLSPVSIDPLRTATFSAAGPNVDSSIKPDLVAVGENYYVATQTFDPAGEMYSPSGYILVDGTSFSTPTTAGAAALLKAARPGLTVAQYRSLLINSATPVNAALGVAATVQQAGAGSLNAGAALLAMVALYPTSITFGAGNAFPQGSVKLVVTNVGSTADTFSFTARPTRSGPVPALSASSVRLEAGASATVGVTFQGSNLTPGSYEGFLSIAGANGKVESRVPYWYGVSSGTPTRITDLDSTTSARRGVLKKDALLFRITDEAGTPVTSVTPEITVTAGDGTVNKITSYDSEVPGLISVNVRLGAAAGLNTFHVVAGGALADFSITGQ